MEKIYRLNEEQATLLMTYLKNTDTVRAFKKELVRQFYLIRRELTARAIAREARKPTRREMTDSIRDCLPESPHKAMYYKHYTDLAYKAALGKTSKELRAERNAPAKANIAEYLTAAETGAVKHVEGQIGVLVEMGLDYQQIKSMLTNKLARVS